MYSDAGRGGVSSLRTWAKHPQKKAAKMNIDFIMKGEIHLLKATSIKHYLSRKPLRVIMTVVYTENHCV